MVASCRKLWKVCSAVQLLLVVAVICGFVFVQYKQRAATAPFCKQRGTQAKRLDFMDYVKYSVLAFLESPDGCKQEVPALRSKPGEWLQERTLLSGAQLGHQFL
jgi:hypothetical protein